MPSMFDPLGERGVRAWRHEEREVGERVRRLEQRFEVGGRQIEAVELEDRWPEGRVAGVDPDDPRHRRVVGQSPQHQLTGAARHTRDRNGRHGPTMPP